MYKRNQVDGAIAEATGRAVGRSHVPGPDLVIRLKRLIETDRAMPLGGKPDGYAFFDESGAGKGVEVSYSAYAAFALYLGVRLIDAGLPQSDAVRFARSIRRELEIEHGAILRKDPTRWLDHAAPYGLDREVRQGFLVRNIETMVFLVVPADTHALLPTFARARAGAPRRLANICRSPDEMNELIAHLSLDGGPILLIELVNIIHRLAYWLNKIEPIKRGRK
jgi:hypothetical protein